MPTQCREVRRVILSLQDNVQGQAQTHIGGHLSKCQACANLYATSQKLTNLLVQEKLHTDLMSQHSLLTKRKILTITPWTSPKKPSIRPKTAWAAAATVLLVAVVAFALQFLKGKDGQNQQQFSTPTTTWSLAAAASVQTLGELTHVVRRHEAPSFELPYTPAETEQEPIFPQLLEQCTVQSRNTLGSILQSKANLTRR